MKKLIALLLVLCTVAGLFCGCGETPAQQETESPAAADSTQKNDNTEASKDSEPAETAGEKSVTIGVKTASMSWDPIKSADDLAHEVNGNIYATLYNCDNDNQYQLELAQAVDISEDGLTWTFTIRDNAFWSNGEPVTAHDFEFAWKRAADPTSGSQFVHLFRLMNIKNGGDVADGKTDPSELGCYAKDDKTFVVELTAPTPYFQSLVCFDPLSPVNEKFYEEMGDTYCTTVGTFLYCGPYMVEHWDPDDNTITMVKNPDYWDAEHVDIDSVTFKMVADPQSGVMSFETGELDYTSLSGDLVAMYESDPSFGNATGNFNWYIYFNSEVITNEKLRQAVAYSMDREAICRDILADASIPQYNIFMSGCMTSPDGKDFNDSTTKHYAYDPEKAKSLWEEAKAEGAPDSMTLTYESDDSSVALVAQYVAATLEATLDGFHVELECIPKANRLENMKSGDYEVALTRWGPNFTDATSTLSLYMTGNVYNYHCYSNETYDELMTAAMTTLAEDYDARWDAMVEAEDLLMQSAVCCPLYQVGKPYLKNADIPVMVEHMTGTKRFWKYITLEG